MSRSQPKRDKVVILAAGLGSRMRRSNESASLNDQQAAIASEGLKALIPIDRPFLDYALTNVAEAGYRQVCLVIGPRHNQIREYYEGLSCEKLQFRFAVQQEPLGTAHALAAAADFSDGDPVLVMNCDNYYPVSAMRQLRKTDGTALAGFSRRGLVQNSDLSVERIAAFSVLELDREGFLTSIVEKPDPKFVEQLPDPVLVSMNCWRFGSAIFEACRAIKPSSRGEYEIPDAVMYSIRHLNERYAVIPSDEGVLDLSTQDDIEEVTARLRGVEVQL